MAAVSKINYRPGIERFYGSIFGDKANQAMTSDQEIWESLSHLRPFEAFGRLHRKGLIVTEVAALIVAAACGAIVKGQDRPIEASPVVAKPQIAYFTKDTIKDPTLKSQLAGVQGLSGKGVDCNPAIVMVEGGKAGGETAGFCTKDNVITNVVVRGERNSTQQTVNEDLITRKHIGPDGKPDIAYVEYGSGDKKVLFTYDYATKITTWHFPSGGIVEFPAAQGPFEELVQKILEPGGVAVAAEIDTPTPTATITATAIPATPTKEAPTPVPATEVPAHSVFDNAPFLDLGKRYRDRLPGPIGHDKYIPGMVGDHLSISHLQLLDFEQVEDDQTPFKLTFGFRVEGKDYAVRVEYNPCDGKNIKLYHGISGKLKVGDVYWIDLYGGTVTDPIAVSQALGEENGCSALLGLKPITKEDSGLFIGLQPDKARTIVDLTGKTYVSSISAQPTLPPQH